MIYWPSTQQNLNTDYSTMQVGVVQYFVQHKICVNDMNSTDKMVSEYHLFAYVIYTESLIGLELLQQCANLLQSIVPVTFYLSSALLEDVHM